MQQKSAPLPVDVTNDEDEEDELLDENTAEAAGEPIKRFTSPTAMVSPWR